jgi:hypothetical protein
MSEMSNKVIRTTDGSITLRSVVIEEVARVALEDPEVRSRIGHELGLTEEQLVEVLQYLESLVEE